MLPEINVIFRNKKRIGENEEVAICAPENLKAETQVIFMIHGNWATYRRYNYWLPYFAQNGFLTIAPTLRRHYKGNWIDGKLGKTSVRNYADDFMLLKSRVYAGDLIPDFIPKYPPIVIGHSMGGLVGQLAAELTYRAGTKLLGLVTLCSAPPAEVSLHTDEDYKKRIKKLGKLILGGKPYLPDRETLAKYVWNNMPPETYDDLWKAAVYESGTSTREILAGSGSGLPRFIARMLSKPIEIDETKITCPILVIGCEKDKIIPKEVALDIYKKYERVNPYTALKIFYGGRAHWPQYESGWEEPANYVIKWIRGEI